MSEKESLELINQMINSARNNLQKGMGNVFLLWGYLVAAISLVIFILLLVLPEPGKYNSYILWCLMAIGGPLHVRLIRKMEQQQLVRTYVDRIMAFLWIGFAVSIVLVILGIIASSVLIVPSFAETSGDFLRWFQWIFITPFMLSIYGFALFISGKAYGYKPLVTGGIICWAASTLLLIFIHHPYIFEIQQIILSVSALCGFVIPGHLLNQKEKSHV